MGSTFSRGLALIIMNGGGELAKLDLFVVIADDKDSLAATGISGHR